MTDRHAKALARLEERLRSGPGELVPATRAAAIEADLLPDPQAQRYVETVRQHAYKLTGRHLEELARAGWTDGQVFELTVAAAFGAAKRRLDAGLAALGETAGLRPPAGEGWGMRLAAVRRGNRWPNRLLIRLVEKVARMELPDVMRTMSYRSGFFGGPYAALLHSLMRGPSEWTVGERELLAAYTSYLNQCPFWTGAHGAVASTVLGDEITKAVFADPDTAPIAGRLRAALGLVRKLTLTPEKVGADDLRMILDAGVSEDAVRDAVYVCFAFNLIDRISDALGFDLMDEKGYRRGAQVLLRVGYKLPAPLRLLARNPAW
jgi:uncharacterized peroxidase-related enzyme